MTRKYCPQCKVVKPRSNFDRDSARRDGIASLCRFCRKALRGVQRPRDPKQPPPPKPTAPDGQNCGRCGGRLRWDDDFGWKCSMCGRTSQAPERWPMRSHFAYGGNLRRLMEEAGDS